MRYSLVVATVWRYALLILATLPPPPQVNLRAITPKIPWPLSRPFNTMAWRSSGATNKDLIENLWKNGLISNPTVKAAFLKVNNILPAPII